jgi:N-acetylneuraminic acid mutarotase
MWAYSIRIRIATASALVLVASLASAQVPGRWVRLAAVPQANEERQGVAANGKLYLFGGNPVTTNNVPGAPPGEVWEYDAAGDRWTKKKNMPLAAHHVAVAEQGGKIYVFGGAVQRQAGQSNYIPVNNAWEYDPAADAWKALAPMPSKRIAAVATSVGGKIYVMGGAGNYASREDMPLNAEQPHRILDTNEAYDPATNTWQARQTMPTPRNHMSSGVVNGRIYLIGGRLASMAVSNGSTTDIVEEYDPATDKWGFLKTRMPTPRDSGLSAVYNGRIYVAGGQSITGISNSVSRALEAYDPATNTWQTLTNLPQARHGAGGGIIGNRLHFVGGHLTAAFSGGEPLNVATHDVFEFAPR